MSKRLSQTSQAGGGTPLLAIPKLTSKSLVNAKQRTTSLTSKLSPSLTTSTSTTNIANPLPLTLTSLALLVTLTLLTILVTLFLNPIVSADPITDSTNTKLNVKVNSTISLTVSNCTDSNPIPGSIANTNITLQPGKESSQCQNLTVDTNASAGYSLTIEASTPNPSNPSASPNNLTHTTISPNPPTIPSTTSPISNPTSLASATNASTGNWGLAVPKTQSGNSASKLYGPFNPTTSNFDSTYTVETNQSSSTAKYANVPTTTTTLAQTDTFPGQPDTYTIYYAVQVPANKAAGTYQTTITYTAIGEELPEPPDYLAKVVADNSITTMQGLTSTLCQSAEYDNTSNGVNSNNTVTLTDTRNNQQYRVRKLADNNCWMIDNLKLELTNGMTLTPADSNVISNTTVYFTQDGTASGTALTGMTGNFTTSGYNTRDGTSSSGSNYDAWRQNDPSNDTYCNGTASDSYGGNINDYGTLTGCGYLYNWYAATAGTGSYNLSTFGATASASICPAGTHLPTAYNGSAYTEFAVLNASMNAGSPTAASTSSSYYAGWQPSGSFSGVFSGNWSYGLVNVSSYAYLWSSSVYSSSDARNTGFYSSYVYPGNSRYSKLNGFAVRCLVGP